MDQWIDFNQTAINPQLYPVIKGVFGWGAIDQTVFNDAVKELKQNVTILNVALQGKDYLVGNHLTVADLVVMNSLILAF